MTHDAWWVRVDGRVDGPKTSLELRQLIRESKLAPDTPISPDQQKWLPAAKVRGLFPSSAPDRAGPIVRNAEGKPFDVFISYSSADKDLANATCAKLESKRIRCWIAPRDIVPGTEWGEAIIFGIDSSSIMLLIFSTRANASPQVRREVERAVSKGMMILPFRIEDVQPSGSMEYALSNTHWLDGFTPPVEQHVDKLAKSLLALFAPYAELVVKKPPKARRSNAKSLVNSSKQVMNRRPIASSLAAAALVAAISLIIIVAPKKEKATTPETEPVPGEAREFNVGNGVNMKFCWVPGTNGKAKLGSPQAEKNRGDDEAEHEVELDGFWMAKYKMTQGQYLKLTGKKNPSWFCADGGGKDKVQGLNTDDFPVERVSWDDAQECIKGMKAPPGMKRFALPSEAQWEWAARAGRGNGQAFYWGDALNGDKANCDGKHPYGTEQNETSLERTEKAGAYETKAPHPWGLGDMAGNLYDWCDDIYGDYANLPRGKNPVQTVKQSNDGRVLRGGSWSSYSGYCRSAARYYVAPDNRFNYFGFRVVVMP
jgi:formylglycine-generating enzyme